MIRMFVASIALLGAVSAALADDYTISSWPDGIKELPCSAFQFNPDGSVTVTATLHIGGPNGITMQGNTFKGTNEARMIEAKCGTPK